LLEKFIQLYFDNWLLDLNYLKP